MWKGKDCGDCFLRRNEVLKHIRLHHRYGRGHAYPCIFEHCPCKCKTWRALIAHLSKFHPAEQSQRGHFSAFKCHLCNNRQLASETEYFQHIGKHLRNHELVSCMFNGCSYQTNLYGAFYTHKWRKHTPYTIRDFKPEAIHGSGSPLLESLEQCDAELGDVPYEDLTFEEHTVVPEETDSPKVIELKFASVLLKLEHSYLVQSAAVNELLEELQYIIGTDSVSFTQKTICDFLQKQNWEVQGSVVKELATVLCTDENPIQAAIGDDGPLSSAWKRKAYYRKNFNVVEPVEYILDHQNRKSSQYVPILKSLQQLLNCELILSKAVNLKEKFQTEEGGKRVYRSFWESNNCKINSILSKECAISLILYIDDFEICNPLGTSRKKTQSVCIVLDSRQSAPWLPLLFIQHLSSCSD